MERLTRVPVIEPTLLDLEMRTLTRLQHLDEQLEQKGPAELSASYAAVMRDFFKAASGLAYEFTYPELLDEFRQRKIGPVTLRALRAQFDKLSAIEFAKRPLPRPELHAELIEARKHVQAVVRSLARTEAPTKEALKQRVETTKQLEAQRAVLTFSRMLLQAERALEAGQKEDAKVLYNQLRTEFAKLPEKERAEMLKRLQALYLRLTGGVRR